MLTQAKIQTNVVYKHCVNSKAKILVEQGGTRSGKTYNILLWIIFKYCTHNTGRLSLFAERHFQV